MGTPGLQEYKYMRNSCTHFTPGVPNLPPQTLPYNSALLDGQVKTSDIVHFSPGFFSSSFPVFPNDKYERSDSEKSGIFKHPTFRVFPNGKYEMSYLKKSKIFKLPILKFPCFLLGTMEGQLVAVPENVANINAMY